MKKRTMITAILLASSLMAKDNVYIGASYDYDLQQYTDDYTGQKVKGNNISTSYSIGKYFNNYRLHMNFQSSVNIGMGGDYMFKLQDSKITPYIGASAYYYYDSVKYSGSSNTRYYSHSNYTNKALTLGLNFCLTYPINKHFEFQTGLFIARLIVSNKNDVNTQSFSTGINYLF